MPTSQSRNFLRKCIRYFFCFLRIYIKIYLVFYLKANRLGFFSNRNSRYPLQSPEEKSGGFPLLSGLDGFLRESMVSFFSKKHHYFKISKPPKRFVSQKLFVGSQQSGLSGRNQLQEANKVVCQAEIICRKLTKWFVRQKSVVGSKQSGLSV